MNLFVKLRKFQFCLFCSKSFNPEVITALSFKINHSDKYSVPYILIVSLYTLVSNFTICNVRFELTYCHSSYAQSRNLDLG